MSVCQLLVELNLRRNPVVSNYQLLVGLNLRRNPVVSIDKLLVELNLRRNPTLLPEGAKLTEKSKGYQLL